jgi:hypothetical protein
MYIWCFGGNSVLYLSRIFFIKYKFWNEGISGCPGYMACVIPFAFHGFIILKKAVVDKCSWLQPLGFVQLGRSISNKFCYLLLWGHGAVVKEEVTGSSRGNSHLQKLQENETPSGLTLFRTRAKRELHAPGLPFIVGPCMLILNFFSSNRFKLSSRSMTSY